MLVRNRPIAAPTRRPGSAGPAPAPFLALVLGLIALLVIVFAWQQDQASDEAPSGGLPVVEYPRGPLSQPPADAADPPSGAGSAGTQAAAAPGGFVTPSAGQ